MDTLTNVINYTLPLISLIFLSLGIIRTRINFVLMAFWLSLIGLIFLYRMAGGEILGSYFDYLNATFYTLYLLVLISGTLYLFFNVSFLRGKYVSYATGFVSACLITGGTILMINLWMNAHFVEDRMPQTAIMQVVSFTPPTYCAYRYVFYKVGRDGKIAYLCPNAYGIIPAVGHLETAPKFLIRYLGASIKMKTGKGKKVHPAA